MLDWLLANPVGVLAVALAGFVFGRVTAKTPQQRERERRGYDAALRKIEADLKPETVVAVRDLLAKKRPIDAIRLVRDTTGCGLKEAKDLMEQEIEGAQTRQDAKAGQS
jgi:ribosomal protein L7/L12